MKAVLIGIRPEWCAKIASGEKKIEVRKSRPKLETPFKVYIYCTKDAKKQFWTGPRYSYVDDHSHNAFDKCGNGKVIGEFVCDRIDKIWKRGCPENFDYCYLSLNEWGNDDIASEINDITASCLSKNELNLYGAKVPWLSGWHISNLKIYDAPRELGDFWLYNEELHKRYDSGTDYCCYDGANEYGEALTDCGDAYLNIRNCLRCWNEWSGWCHHLKRAPQSWCYVEEIE